MMKLLAGGALLATAAVFSGCGDSVPSNANALYKENNQAYNVMGLYSSYPASYKDVPSTTLEVRPGDFSVSRDVSGNNTSILFGLVTFADYY